MIHTLSAVDPQTTLASGNVYAILALIIVVLAGVVIYLAKKLFDSQRDSAIEIKELNKLLYSEGKAHATDYKEMAKSDQVVMQGNTQSNELLAAKIEAVKGRH